MPWIFHSLFQQYISNKKYSTSRHTQKYFFQIFFAFLWIWSFCLHTSVALKSWRWFKGKLSRTCRVEFFFIGTVCCLMVLYKIEHESVFPSQKRLFIDDPNYAHVYFFQFGDSPTSTRVPYGITISVSSEAPLFMPASVFSAFLRSTSIIHFIRRLFLLFMRAANVDWIIVWNWGLWSSSTHD